MREGEWGNLRADPLHRDVGAGPDEPATPERAADAGAWPENMEAVRYYADSSLTIPGKSEPPSACGEWGYREFCDDCGEPYAAPHRCQQRKCPDCWLTWRGDRAAAMTERLAAARRDAEGADARLTHCVASPPPDSITSLVDYWDGYSDAYDLAQRKGLNGGVVVAHGWRVKQEVKEVYRELSDAEVITEGGLWRFVREHEKDWRTLTYWSPHYHILALGADVGADDPDEQDRWVFRRISHRGDSSLPRFDLTNQETYEPMFAAAMYVLSHVGFQADEQKQVVRWFGSLSYNKFGGVDELKNWERSAVCRNVEEIAGRDFDGDGAGSEPERECRNRGCEGTLRSIWHARRWLADPEWCSQIGREQERRLLLAFDWACGEVVPPPGLQRPQSREHLTEAFEAIMEQR